MLGRPLLTYSLSDFLPFLAHGIIVPLLNTADDARSLVKSAKFPPAGQRGFGSPFAMEKFGGVTQTEYLQQANDSLLTIVQVETQDALRNVFLYQAQEGNQKIGS